MSIIETARAKEFVNVLRARVSDRTLRHCIFAAEYMASFAAQAEIANDEAVTAALLHDLCKGMTDAELLAAATEHGIVLNDTQRLKPGLLHGPVAAEECRRDLGIADQAVYDAIYWHSTGRREWGKVGLALYVADFAEPSRTYSEAEEARRILRSEGFKPALRYVSTKKLERLRTKPHVDPATEAFREWLTAELER